jgi:AbrB family looped-hinge helix DNA binding protein
MHEQGKKLYGTATVGSKGQIVIPVDAREEFHISEGDRLYVVGSTQKGILGLFKEETLETFIENMNIEVESLKALKDNKKGII